MSDYLVLYATGESQEVEAEFCHGDGQNLIFSIDQVEVARVRASEVASISKASRPTPAPAA